MAGANDTARGDDDLVRLRQAESLIVRLRYLAIVAWPLILVRGPFFAPPTVVWGLYALIVAYVVATDVVNRSGRGVRSLALATTLADPTAAAAGCFVTGGVASHLYPFFYLTTLATSIRFDLRETLAVVIWNGVLSWLLHVAAPGSASTPADLALRVFYLFFVAIEGGLLSRAARDHYRGRQELLRRLIHAGEEERRRLAGEIHDRLGRRFFEFYHGIDRRRAAVADRDPATAGLLDALSDEARACADEIRAVTNELRPVVLDDFGFVEALREDVALLQSRGELEVALRIVQDGAPPPSDVGVMLYRALQEAVLNIRKHAHARHLDIVYEAAANGGVRLSLRDDGKGFDPAVPQRGRFGLLYMRERVEAYGGKLEVRSRPAGGTNVSIVVPPPSPKDA